MSGEEITFYYESTFPVAVETLFAWHERPEALSKLIKKEDRIRIKRKDPSLEVGSETHIELYFGPFSISWIVQHTAYKKGAYFVDEQLKGPFKSWTHRHLFFSEGNNQSRLRDELCFSLPFSWITHILFKRMIFSKLKRDFAYRHQKLYEELTASAQLINS